MEDGRRARLGLTALVAAETLTVASLHRLGSVDGFAIPHADLGRWLHNTPSEDVLLVGVRLAALVAAWWLLATTLLYVATRLAHLHRTARAVGWATLPAVRGWADRAAAVTIVAASALAAARPGAAGPPPTTGPAPPPVVIDLDHRDRSGVSVGTPAGVRTGLAPNAPTAPPDSPPVTVPAPPTSPPLPSAAPPPASSGSHVIVPGEHLWSIAADHVAAATGRDPDDLSPAEIAPYWRRVVEHNRSRLRSSNPDLVYPDETIELPPL